MNLLSPDQFIRKCSHLRTRCLQKHSEVDSWYEREIRLAEEALESWHRERWKVPPPPSLIAIPGRAAPLVAVKGFIKARRAGRWALKALRLPIALISISPKLSGRLRSTIKALDGVGVQLCRLLASLAGPGKEARRISDEMKSRVRRSSPKLPERIGEGGGRE